MSPQADYVVSNGTGAAVRSDINGQLAAIVSNNSGASAPATTYAYMLWADTSTNLLKLRNGANSAWITVGDLTAANLGLAALASPTFTGTATIPTLTVSTAANIPLGSAASPTLYFTGDSNTGLYSPGADQVALSTGGTGRLFINSSGAVGIGTSSPETSLHVSGITRVTSGADGGAYQLRYSGANASSRTWRLINDVNAYGDFDVQQSTTQTGSTFASRLYINPSGQVGIGSTSPGDFNQVVNAPHLVIGNGTTSSPGVTLYSTTAGAGIVAFADGTTGNQQYRGYIQYDQNVDQLNLGSNGPITFNTGTERARIDSSGRLLVGTSSSIGYGGLLQVVGGDTARPQIHRNINDQYPPIIYFSKARGTGAQSVSSGDALGQIGFIGYDGTGQVAAAAIDCFVDATPGTNDMPGRLVFSTTADGASSPTERLRISNTGILTSIATYNNTVSNAANAHFGADGVFYRSTSSIKYKTNVQTLEDKYADAILSIRPVWYQSKTGNDNPSWGWWGFIAEEVAAIDPRLVHWKTVEVTYDEKGAAVQSPCEPEPEGVQYDRFVPHLLNLIKRQQQAIETLETKVAALESA